MTDTIQAMIQLGAASTPFPVNSRYHATDIAVLETSDGRKIAYLRRRFVPPSENFALIQEHSVVAGDRLDNLAFKYLGDPLQFWRICDANNAMDPGELTKHPGRRLRITLPEGIAGVNYG